MFPKKHGSGLRTTLQLLVLVSSSGLAIAQPSVNERATDPLSNPKETQSNADIAPARYEAASRKHVDDAVAVVRKMESEPGMKPVLQQAKGVFIVPNYGRAAFGVGGKGGSGVLLVKRENGTWSDPAFFNIGGVNIGLQAGVEGGPVAMVLNNDKAVNRFTQNNNFSLSADAGITVVNWAKMAQGSTGGGDVVAWSGTKGLFGDLATLGFNDIKFNQNMTKAYYGRPLSAHDVMAGKGKNVHSNALKRELASIQAESSTGSQGGTERSGAPTHRK